MYRFNRFLNGWAFEVDLKVESGEIKYQNT